MGAVDTLGESDGGIRERDYLGPVSPNDSGFESHELPTSVQPETRSPSGHRVEDPWPPGAGGELGGELHGRQPVGSKGADVDAEGVSIRGEVRELLEGMEHGGRSAGGEKGVGHQVHGHEVGDALDKRRSPPHFGEEGPGDAGPVCGGFSHRSRCSDRSIYQIGRAHV